MMSLLFRGLATMALAIGLALPAHAQTHTVTDTLDRTVEIPVDPQRILLGFYFEDFYAVGGPDAYERVVAISRDAWAGWRSLQWAAYSAADPRLETLIDVGEVDAGTFSIETAIAANPDLAILAAWQYSALGDVVSRFDDAGIPVVVADYNAQTVEKHVASTLLLGAVLGTQERARALAGGYKSAVADVLSRVEKAEGAPKAVYVELGNRGPHEVGNSYSGHMWGNLITLAGGRNIADGQIARWAPLSPEYVLAQNPDVIFLAGSGWAGRDRAVRLGPGVEPPVTHDRMRPYLERAGWQGLKAVRNGQLHALYHGGARTLYDFAFLQYIAQVLHPEAFADVDPLANLDRFFADYMPVRFSGTYFTRLP